MIDISDLGITPEEFAARVKIYDIGAHVQIVIDADLDQSIQLFGVGNVQTVTQADFII